jgi:glutamate-ammonia-ligase adenylyltransferase
MRDEKIKEAADATPDPERSLKNLASFLKENPSRADELEERLRHTAVLFSVSQFLANYCIASPDRLFEALRGLELPQNREVLFSSLEASLREDGFEPLPYGASPRRSLDPYMNAVREFKMRELLRITLRDILGKGDLIEVMLELSCLAEVILENSLQIVRKAVDEVYGIPKDDAFSVISLGKLGGEELNFSSDVDLIYVYGTEKGETTGVRTGQGVSVNRISNHEYYCKVGEMLTRFLSLNTEAGFAYRVDLRLRPEGQRGDIALALRGYEMYYESWGRAWERAMLIRARPVAGDHRLGEDFLEMIRPFVYRKYLDFSSIDEIRRLKTRIDSTFKRGDIKRGYGGIREIEFFAQALQLIYGGREPLLRERSILKALHRLLQKALMGQEDYFILSDNYRYMRTLEHRLQQLNDLQTHALPSGMSELEALGKKMGFRTAGEFLEDLEGRRSRVRGIYDSLFSGKKADEPLKETFFDEELSDAELKEYLKNTGLKDVERAIRNIRSIKDSTFAFQTLRGRRFLGEIIPVFLDASLKCGFPDMALNHLQSFAQLLSVNESYLEIFSRDKRLVEMLTRVFAQSEYLSKMLMSRPDYLEMIGWQEMRRKSRALLIAEIQAGISEGHTANEAVRLLKQAEEIRLGLLFLDRKAGVIATIKGLSRTAEAILSVCTEHVPGWGEGMALIGFGKLGGREITFNSDLDLIFVSSGEVRESDSRAAEKLLRMLVSYTRDGIAYRADTRLRPDGSKGPLVSSIESFEKYYSGPAAFWEFQALLKARPVAGDVKTGVKFIDMAKGILMSRGAEVSPSDIRQMRDRILRELSKETEGYDIKLGPGGIEEIEFTVQYLQLVGCREHHRVLVQGTLDAVNRLEDARIIRRDEAEFIRETYLFYRTLESFLRLRGENILKRDDERIRTVAGFMGFTDGDAFIKSLETKRETAGKLFEKYLSV